MSDLPVPRRSFAAMLGELSRVDDELADPDLDIEALIGDLRDKVDGLSAMQSRMELTALWLRDIAAPLIAKARSLEKNRERLREYIVQAMEEQNVTVFPGNAFKLSLQAASQPALHIRPAEPGDVAAWPELAECQRKYVWKTDAVKAALSAGLLPDAFPGRLIRSNWPDFKPNIPETLERKRKPRSKKVELTKTEPKALPAAADEASGREETAGRECPDALAEVSDHVGTTEAYEPGPLDSDCPD